MKEVLKGLVALLWFVSMVFVFLLADQWING
jgi:hypothetical protein